MRSPILFAYLFSSVALLGIVHYAALEYYLYWQFPWFDIPVHFLGGIVVGLGFLLIPYFFSSVPERYMSFKWMLVFALTVGLLWELFEIFIGIPLIESDFEIDMFFDLAMDLCGATAGYFVGRNVRVIEHDAD